MQREDGTDGGTGVIATAERRAMAERIFAAGVAAADPAAAVGRALRGTPPPAGRRLVLGVGKAARRMVAAALETLGPSGRTEALVVTNYENAADLPGARVLAAGHPVPDLGGARASAVVIEAVSGLGAGDELIALISGGGSALLPAPLAGLSLEDKAEVNRLLLASGADITEMNLVRQALSRLKGGGLARLAAPARVRALILSDVVGDDLRVIASGPTVAPLGGAAEARAALVARGLWDRLPAPVRAALEQAAPPGPLPPVENLLIGSNAISVAAMAAAAADLAELPPVVVSDRPLTGDVAEAAARVIDEAAGLPGGRGCLLFGGETTVVLRGDGRGGRNQELALRVALLAETAGWGGPWVFLSGGTDGRDGPTEAAGGLVDGGTPARVRAAGADPETLLARNDSHAALAAAGDLLTTGATGTNVADLQVLIRG